MSAGEEDLGSALFSSGLEDEVDAYTTDFVSKTDAASLLTVSTAVPCHGAKAGLVTYGTSASTAYAVRTFSAQSDLYIRLYVYFHAMVSTSDSGGVTYINAFSGATSQLQLALLSGTSAKKNQWYWYQSVRNPGTVIYSGTLNEITMDTWYCWEMHYVKSATVGGMQVWLDGVSKGSNFTLNTNSYAIDSIRVGTGTGTGASSALNAGALFYFDDVRVAAAGPIGAYVAPVTGWPGLTLYHTVA